MIPGVETLHLFDCFSPDFACGGAIRRPQVELNVRQTRAMFLADTVPLPRAFPTAAPLTIEEGCLCHACDERHDDVFVSILEETELRFSVSRVILLKNVAAIFFPGVWTKDGGKNVFNFAEPDAVDDMDKGEWFLKSNLDPKKISQKLKIDISRSDSGARGIVFVPRNAPVVTIEESVRPASAFSDDVQGCD
jgi:hypothetical protein